MHYGFNLVSGAVGACYPASPGASAAAAAKYRHMTIFFGPP